MSCRSCVEFQSPKIYGPGPRVILAVNDLSVWFLTFDRDMDVLTGFDTFAYYSACIGTPVLFSFTMSFVAWIDPLNLVMLQGFIGPACTNANGNSWWFYNARSGANPIRDTQGKMLPSSAIDSGFPP